jgi:hypothetical protein
MDLLPLPPPGSPGAAPAGGTAWFLASFEYNHGAK